MLLLPHWLWIVFLYVSDEGKLGFPNFWCCGGGPSCVDASYSTLLLGGVGWAHTVGCFFIFFYFSSTREGIRWKISASSAQLCLWRVIALLWFLCWSVQPFKGRYGFWRGPLSLMYSDFFFFNTSDLFLLWLYWISHSRRGQLCKSRINSGGVEYSWCWCSKTAKSFFFSLHDQFSCIA